MGKCTLHFFSICGMKNISYINSQKGIFVIHYYVGVSSIWAVDGWDALTAHFDVCLVQSSNERWVDFTAHDDQKYNNSLVRSGKTYHCSKLVCKGEVLCRVSGKLSCGASSKGSFRASRVLFSSRASGETFILPKVLQMSRDKFYWANH